MQYIIAVHTVYTAHTATTEHTGHAVHTEHRIHTLRTIHMVHTVHAAQKKHFRNNDAHPYILSFKDFETNSHVCWHNIRETISKRVANAQVPQEPTTPEN